MAKVHIALVGGQPAPIFYAIKATKPDKVVYIHSQQTIRTVEFLRQVIQIPEDRVKPLDATEPKKIMARVSDLTNKYRKDEVTLNIAGGTKAWSHIFGYIFQDLKNATVVYMDQNNVLWNYKSMEGTLLNEMTGFEFDMDTHIKLYGNKLENYSNIVDFTNDDEKVAKKLEQLWTRMPQEFTPLLSTLTLKQQNFLKTNPIGSFSTKNDSEVTWQRPSKNNPDVKTSVELVLKTSKSASYQVLESPHAIDLAFNTGWFEFKVAKMLSKWNESKEIRLNCVFPAKVNGAAKNEVDVLVNTGSKLLFVECKTQIFNTTDIDKFSSVVKSYGGLGSKGIFITHEKMSDIAKEKCEQHGLLCFSLKDEHMKMNEQQALELLLNSALTAINA